MFFHGGGWVLGGATTHDRLVRELADGVRAGVILVDPDRAPEAKYPTQNEQAFAAMTYALEHGPELRLDASRLAVMGDSAGGNMAAAVTLLAKECGGPRIAHQVLFYPNVDYLSNDASYRTFAGGPWLTAETMRWFFDLEGLDGSEDYHAYPLRATVDRLRGLPDALIVTADDILQSEGEAYAAKLAEAGVRVTSVRYDGTNHDFAMLAALADPPAARAAVRQAIAARAHALHG
jgi:acetyl esterase